MPEGEEAPTPPLFRDQSPQSSEAIDEWVEPDVSDESPAYTAAGVESSVEADGTSQLASASLPSLSAKPAGVGAWQEELSERLENYRRRRAHLSGGSDSNKNLEFDFDDSIAPTLPSDGEVVEATAADHPEGFDVELEQDARPGLNPSLGDSLEFERKSGPSRVLDYSDAETAGPVARGPRRPVEIILDPPPRSEDPELAAVPGEWRVAPLGRRFIGGMIDAGVLLFAGGIFALIFWRAGGHLTRTPLNLAVVGFIGVFFVLSYFWTFTALTSTTPGLLWVGIEVRSLNGGQLTPRQALWRTFGYLVSASALLLGFVWAAVDSEGLTWHDRISDTFLVSSDAVPENREAEVED